MSRFPDGSRPRGAKKRNDPRGGDAEGVRTEKKNGARDAPGVPGAPKYPNNAPNYPCFSKLESSGFWSTWRLRNSIVIGPIGFMGDSIVILDSIVYFPTS